MTAKRQRRKALPGFEPDRGPPERYQHGDVIVDSPTETAGVVAKRVMTQRTIDRYLARQEIDARQHDAGERLYHLWYRAGRSPVVTANLMGIGGRDEAVDGKRSEAWADLNRAMRHVGVRLSPILVHVCLCDETAASWARKAHQSPRDGIVILRLALDVLGDFFGLAVR